MVNEMKENALYNKKIWLCAALLTVIAIAVSFHLNVKKKSAALAALRTASNLTLTQTPPKWIRYIPKFAVSYLEPTFSVQADFTLEDAVSILDIPEDKNKKAISLNESCRLLNDLGNVEVLNVDCSRQPEIDHVEYIDSLLEIDSLREISIIGDRLKLKKVHTLPKLRKFSLECTDVSSAVFQSISNSSKLERLIVRTKAFINEDCLTHFKNFKALKTLDLDGLKCSEEALSFIENMKSLETLNLSSFKQQIVSSWGEGGLKLPGSFKLNKSLSYLKNNAQIAKIGAIVVLDRENLSFLNKHKLHPTAYYQFPKVIDDAYLLSLGEFLSRFNAAQDSVVSGIIKNLELYGQKNVSDKSIPFLKKFKPPYLDLRGTSITKMRDLPLDTAMSFRLPENSNISEAIPNITNKEYDTIDLRGSKITDFDLAKILKQVRPKIFYMDGENLTEKSIDNAMDYFNERPKGISKISFGNWDIPQKRRLEFLDRVHQWGMAVVYSSHLTPDLILLNWHLHKSKTVIHDRRGNLNSLDKIFPNLKTLVLRGLPLSEDEWSSLHRLKNFDSLYIESPHDGQAMNKSKILTKIENFDIKGSMLSAVKLTDNIEKCRVILQNGEKLENVIDLSSGSPDSLVIDGDGSLNFNIFKDAKNLKSLSIGPEIQIHGEISGLEQLESLKCLSRVSKETLNSASSLKKIKLLLLNCELLDSETFSKWTGLSSLEVLDLAASDLKLKDLRPLQAFKKLKVLNLPAHEGITADVLALLQENKVLYKLNIFGTSIVPKDLDNRYSMPGHWDFEL